MKVQVHTSAQQEAIGTLSLRCPVCRQIGILERVGLEFAKELLKAVYQYSALLQKLRALKKQP